MRKDYMMKRRTCKDVPDRLNRQKEKENPDGRSKQVKFMERIVIFQSAEFLKQNLKQHF